MSLIQSNFANFGSGVVPDGAGFALQSRGGLFTLDPAHPNALAPRKRPLQTIIPGVHDARATCGSRFGIMGGWNQPQAHVAVRLEHRRSRHEHPGGARGARASTKLTFAGCDVMMESRVPGAVARRRSTRKGHEIDLQGEFSNMVGGGQSVMRDDAPGVNYGASDPRKDGAAIPEPFLS